MNPRTETAALDRARLSDALRSELIFLGASGSAERIDDCVVILTPDNPTYWWGNTLHFDAAPVDGDFARWNTLFERHVEALQPLSTHRTFGWDGDTRGAIEPFVDAGYTVFDALILAADRETVLATPRPDAASSIAVIGGDDWAMLCELLIVTRDDHHTEAGYRIFAERRIAAWRMLADSGQGAWFGAWSDGVLQSALGVFVEAAAADDGRRIGRFQNVMTLPAARRRGYAGALVVHASHAALDHFGADRLLIMADADAPARRVYEAAGYRVIARQLALELGSK